MDAIGVILFVFFVPAFWLLLRVMVAVAEWTENKWPSDDGCTF